MNDDLFPDAVIPEKEANTCRSCEHRQRWLCGGKIIQYCGVRNCNRTDNGLLKIKAKDKACKFYEEEK